MHLCIVLQVVPFDGTVYTFGFGADHDAGLLEAISQAAEGSYYYIDSAEKVHWCSVNHLPLNVGVIHGLMYVCVSADSRVIC